MDDDGAVGYRVVVDDIVVTDPPLASEPSLDDVVRIYADWLAQSH